MMNASSRVVNRIKIDFTLNFCKKNIIKLFIRLLVLEPGGHDNLATCQQGRGDGPKAGTSGASKAAQAKQTP